MTDLSHVANQLQQYQFSYSALEWGATDATLYAVDQGQPQDFIVLGADPSGLSVNRSYDAIAGNYTSSIHFDTTTGLVYSDGGQVIQPSDGTVVGTYGASGLAVPDSTLDRIFILGQTPAQTGTSNYTLESFDQTKFTPISSITVDNVVGTPTALVRWGANGLAFTSRIGDPASYNGAGAGQLYVISGDFVKPANADAPPSSHAPLLPLHLTPPPKTAATRSGPAFILKQNPLTQ